MNIVILGVSGFLGDATSRSLAAAGHRVVGVSRRSPICPDPKVRYVNANYDSDADTAAHYRDADLILHMAWDTHPSASAAQAALEVGANLLPLSRLLDSLQRSFSGRIVFVSTGGALYGDRPESDLGAATSSARETDAANPASYYGAAKGAAELMLTAFANQTDIPLTILRPSNVYGPGQTARNQFAVVPTLLQSLRDGRPFHVRGDGSAERDYLYINDFVAFVTTYMDYLPGESAHSVFNVCCGRSTSLSDLIGSAEQVTGRDADVRYEACPSTDLRHVRLSAERALAVLGWTAQTSITEGLTDTWAWLLAGS